VLLRDRVVVVAGVGPGLGVALARTVVARGGAAVLSARSADRLSALAAELGRTAVAVPGDLLDPAAAQRLVGAAVERFGRVDGIVYNAAVVPPLRPVAEDADGDLRETIAISVDAPRRLVQAALPVMGAGGSVVFVGSAVVRHPKPGFGAYNVGKHALLGLARSLALELGPSGIRVNTLAVGKIDGERLQRYLAGVADRRGEALDVVRRAYVARIALGRLPAPEEYADAAAFLLSDLSRAVTGHVLDANGGEYFD
jgi:NAD(P)-dependent dehydrogenase (short-subunit alcohol dehydrogenase family)